MHQSASTILKSSNSPSSGRHSPRPIARRLSRSSSTLLWRPSGSWSWGQDGSSASMSSRSVSACVFSRSPSRSPRQAGSVIAAVALDEENVEEVVGVLVAVARGAGVAFERPHRLRGDAGMTECARQRTRSVFHSRSLHGDGESARAHVDANGAGGGPAGDGNADKHAGGVLVPGEDAERRGGGRRRDAGSHGALARDVASLLPLRRERGGRRRRIRRGRLRAASERFERLDARIADKRSRRRGGTRAEGRWRRGGCGGGAPPTQNDERFGRWNLHDQKVRALETNVSRIPRRVRIHNAVGTGASPSRRPFPTPRSRANAFRRCLRDPRRAREP